MGQSSGKKLLTAIGLIGVGVAAGLLIAEAMNSRREQSAIRGVLPLSRLLARFTYSLDRGGSLASAARSSGCPGPHRYAGQAAG
jgi:hypothetical protein